MAPGDPPLKWRQSFVFGINLLLHLVLFLLFLAFFGVPSIEKYLERKTIVIFSEEQTNGIEAPAITFAPSNFSIFGWRTVNESMNDPTTSFDMVHHCQKLNTTDIESCISRDTFQLDDFMKVARLGFYGEEHSFLNESSSSLWTEDITIPFMGRHFTLKPSQVVTRDPSDTLAFFLDAGFSYSVFIHDENFFLINYNPMALPSRVWIVKGETHEGGAYYYKITLTKHKRLNLEGRPCEEDPRYNFNTCVKKKLSAKVGCRLSWDKWSRQEREICTTDQQFRDHGEIYKELMTAVMDEIVDTTGCKKPCTYKEYKFTSSAPIEESLTRTPQDQIFIAFWAVSRTTQVLTLIPSQIMMVSLPFLLVEVQIVIDLN